MKHLKSFKVFESYEKDNLLSEIVRELKTQGLIVQTEDLPTYGSREDVQGLPENLPIQVGKISETSSLDLIYSFTRYNWKDEKVKVLGDLTWSDEDQHWTFMAKAYGKEYVSVPGSGGDIDYERLANILKRISHPTNYRSR